MRTFHMLPTLSVQSVENLGSLTLTGQQQNILNQISLVGVKPILDIWQFLNVQNVVKSLDFIALLEPGQQILMNLITISILMQRGVQTLKKLKVN